VGTRWTGNPSPGEHIEADYVQTLRDAIDQAFTDARPVIPPWSWTWPRNVLGSRVLAKHFTEMRAAIQRLWDNKGRGELPGWTSGVTPGGPSNSRASTPIRATDIHDLRRWLNQYEDNHPKHGVDAKTYAPSFPNRPMIQVSPSNQNWVQDIRNLSPRTLFIRADIRARRTEDGDNIVPLSSTDTGYYKLVFEEFRSQGMPVFAVLTNLWFDPPGLDVKESVDNPEFSNGYIEAFALAAKSLAAEFMTAGVFDYVIWNEPNIDQGLSLQQENFASLLWHTRQQLNTLSFQPRMYWGGVWLRNTPTIASENSNYIEEVYDALVNANKASPTGPWPWDGINLHIHRVREQPFVDSVFNDLLRDKLRIQRNDRAIWMVGEWGITVEDYYEGKRLTPTYNRLRAKADLMAYFSHHYNFEINIGTWGTRRWSEEQPPQPDTGITPGKTLIVPPNDKTELYEELQDAYSTGA
jgi:hypothetical protein